MALTNKDGINLALSLNVSQRLGEATSKLSINMSLTPYKEEAGILVIDEDAVPVQPIVKLDALTDGDTDLLIALGEVEAAIQKYLNAKNI